MHLFRLIKWRLGLGISVVVRAPHAVQIKKNLHYTHPHKLCLMPTLQPERWTLSLE